MEGQQEVVVCELNCTGSQSVFKCQPRPLASLLSLDWLLTCLSSFFNQREKTLKMNFLCFYTTKTMCSAQLRPLCLSLHGPAPSLNDDSYHGDIKMMMTVMFLLAVASKMIFPVLFGSLVLNKRLVETDPERLRFQFDSKLGWSQM